MDTKTMTNGTKKQARGLKKTRTVSCTYLQKKEMVKIFIEEAKAYFGAYGVEVEELQANANTKKGEIRSNFFKGKRPRALFIRCNYDSSIPCFGYERLEAWREEVATKLLPGWGVTYSIICSRHHAKDTDPEKIPSLSETLLNMEHDIDDGLGPWIGNIRIGIGRIARKECDDDMKKEVS